MNIVGVYPTHFLVISPLLICINFLSPQMDTGDPGFSDFMDNIMFRSDGSGKASEQFELHVYVHVCVA